MANRIGGEHEIGIEYFMKVRAYISIGVVNRRIRNRTSESSELVRFLIRQHFVRIYIYTVQNTFRVIFCLLYTY